MRNPKESWGRSDSIWDQKPVDKTNFYHEHPLLGKKDLKLAATLCGEGKPNRKFLRQISVSADVIAPWYWWKEYATYKIGTTENSTSQMHKMGSRFLKKEDFVVDVWDRDALEIISIVNRRIRAYQKAVSVLNSLKEISKMTGTDLSRERVEEAVILKKKVWRTLIQSIPASYIYKRTISLNYEVLANQYQQRKHHKLVEWREYLHQMVNGLPHPFLFMGGVDRGLPSLEV
jgi:hypothetical protein